MIIVRSPLRISLGGGGTDLPSYYEQFGGGVLSAAIDKYVYIIIHTTFQPRIFLKYSRMEDVQHVDDIQHPIIREALRKIGLVEPRLELASMADIPAGTGLGSSGSFTTALLKALHIYKGAFIHPRELAEQACDIEMNILREPVGKQDQYAAAFGGITFFRFHTTGAVDATPLHLPEETHCALEDHLLLFFTGFSRAAGEVLKDQEQRTRNQDKQMIDNLHFIKQIGIESRSALEQGNLRRFAELMHEHWIHKRQRSGGMTNDQIDAWYALARTNGAIGGKLVGAGGGGFLMFYTEEPSRLRQVFRDAGLREVRFRFDHRGTEQLMN